MKIDFLQIGFEKCGTSFLTRNVYPYNPHLEFIHAPSHRELGDLLLRDFILADGFEYDRQSFERKFADICKTVFTNEQAQVREIMFRAFTYSYERRFDRKNVIDRIYDSFPGVKIIMPIRSQRTWLLSVYWTYLRNGGLLSLYDFVEAILDNENLVAHYIDWFPLVSYLYKLFGSERVLIYPYEELKRSPQGMANRLFDFLGVPHVEIDGSPVNRSPSKEVMLLRRFLNHLVHFGYGTSNYNYTRPRGFRKAKPSRMSSLHSEFTYEFYAKYTDRLCRIIDLALKSKSRFELEERHIKMIGQRYSSNNKKLSELLNVDLFAYGYP